MTVITGETGAGKSIAIDALGLCLGGRAEADMVRTGRPAPICVPLCAKDTPAALRWREENQRRRSPNAYFAAFAQQRWSLTGALLTAPRALSQLRELGAVADSNSRSTCAPAAYQTRTAKIAAG